MLGHVRVMPVVVLSLLCALVRPDDVTTPEEKAVCDKSANLNNSRQCMVTFVINEVTLTAAFAINIA